MKVSDFRQLGMLPLQDHRDLLPEFRVSVTCGRVERRDEFGKYTIEGHQESESSVQTKGDLLGGFFVEEESKAKRQQGAWFFAGGFITTEGSKRAEDLDPRQTRTRATEDAAVARTVKARPVKGLRWDPDDRFKELEVEIHPKTSNLPKGSPLVVLTTTKEDEQQLLGFPSANNVLISANAAGDPMLSSIVYDLTPEDELDDDRNAFLHTFWRVVALGGGCALGDNDSLAWQLGLSGLDGLDGRGLVIDVAGVPAAQQLSSPQPGSIPGHDQTGTTQIGGSITRDRFLEELYDKLAGGRADRPTGSGGAVTVLGQTKERPKNVSETRPPPEADNPTAAPTGLVVASVSARSSGPIDVGDAADVHRIGLTRDGMAINAAHLSCNSLFRNEIGDGPLDFEADEWEEPAFGGPFLTPVHLRWDAGVSHAWACGVAPGRWRWVAESYFFIPEEKTKTTTKPPWECLPPPPPTDPPPRECQNIPPSAGTGGPAGAGGLTGFGPGGRLPVGGEITVTPGGGSGFQGTSNSGVTILVPGLDGPSGTAVGSATRAGKKFGWAPLVDPDVDVGLGPGRVGRVGRAPPRDPTPGGGDSGRAGGDGGVGDGSAGSGEGGGMVPGSEPRRPREKQITGWKVGPGIGGHFPPDRFGTVVSTPLRELIPIGGVSVFGGGNLPPATQIALRNEGVIDRFGRPDEVPPPRVGDGRSTRVRQLGGVVSRTPTAAQTMGYGGGIKFAAAATADGEVDFTRGGWIQKDIALLGGGGSVGAFVGFGAGNGTWDDLVAPEGQESIPGGVILGPPEVTKPENLRRLFDGDFHFDSQFANNVLGAETRLYIPGNLAQLYFAHPSSTATSRVVGAGGVRMAQTSTGLLWTVLTGAGDDSGTTMLWGEGGLTIVGNVNMTGKLTVGGSIDPTDLQLTDRDGGTSTIPAAAAGLFYDSDDDTRPIWKEDNVAGDGLEHVLAYLTDATGGFLRGCQAFRNTTQSITPGGTTTLQLNAENFDPNNFHSNVTNNTRITPTEAGLYDVKASLLWASNSTGVRVIGIQLNGSTTLVASRWPAAAGAPSHFMSTGTTVELNGTTDFVEMTVLQDSGGNLNVVGGSVANGGMTLQRIN